MWCAHVGQEIPVLVYTLLMCKQTFTVLELVLLELDGGAVYIIQMVISFYFSH